MSINSQWLKKTFSCGILPIPMIALLVRAPPSFTHMFYCTTAIPPKHDPKHTLILNFAHAQMLWSTSCLDFHTYQRNLRTFYTPSAIRRHQFIPNMRHTSVTHTTRTSFLVTYSTSAKHRRPGRSRNSMLDGLHDLWTCAMSKPSNTVCYSIHALSLYFGGDKFELVKRLEIKQIISKRAHFYLVNNSPFRFGEGSQLTPNQGRTCLTN